jgi:hypothetical protein
VNADGPIGEYTFSPGSLLLPRSGLSQPVVDWAESIRLVGRIDVDADRPVEKGMPSAPALVFSRSVPMADT